MSVPSVGYVSLGGTVFFLIIGLRSIVARVGTINRVRALALSRYIAVYLAFIALNYASLADIASTARY